MAWNPVFSEYLQHLRRRYPGPNLPRFSVPALAGHVPWAVGLVSSLNLQVSSLGNLALKLVTKRLKEGAKYYDLFYHIVSCRVLYEYLVCG